MFSFRCFALLLGLFSSSFAMAQDIGTSQNANVLVVNLERLFAESLIGQGIRTEFDKLEAEAQLENDRLVVELTAEEQALSEQRPDMEIADFRVAAAAFDAKVQSIRAERDAKDRELTQARADAETRFREQVRGIVGEVMLDRNGIVVLDGRTVFLSLRSADITDEVVARLDAIAQAQTDDQ